MADYYTNMDEQTKNERVHTGPRSPYADSPYIMAHQPIYDNGIPQREKKPRKTVKRFICAVLAAVLLVSCCCITGICVNNYWQQKMQVFNETVDNRFNVLQEQLNALKQNHGSSGSADVQDGGKTVSQIYAQNVQAVVAVSNQYLTTNIYGQVSQTASSGSGFIISEDGYVVSNYHVVEGANTLRVITSDSREYDAKLVGYDAVNDLAVLKIDATGLPYVKIGRSDDLAVGDQVLAIGNPLGELTSTLTVGYVSAKDRMVNTDGTSLNMLQTDAAINSGNSGGPLFNMNGEVVGITTAKYSGTSASGATIEGIGFAIPMDDAVDLIEDLVKQGYISGAYLGVMVRDMDPTVAQNYGMPLGVYVEEVTRGSCAETAGVKAKDIIVNLGGYDITSMSALSRALRKFDPGQTTTITVYRGGGQVHLNVTFDEKPNVTEETPESEQPSTAPDFGSIEDWLDKIFP